FQVGQLFGSDRVSTGDKATVAPGDEIAVLRTTVGFLSRGVSQQTTIKGGEGDDTFQVYSNQAEMSLEGEAGDDTFIVRSFALADENGKALVDPVLSKIAQSMAKQANASGGTGADVIQYN